MCLLVRATGSKRFPFYFCFYVEIGYKNVDTVLFHLKLIICFFFIITTTNYTILPVPSIIRQWKVVLYDKLYLKCMVEYLVLVVRLRLKEVEQNHPSIATINCELLYIREWLRIDKIWFEYRLSHFFLFIYLYIFIYLSNKFFNLRISYIVYIYIDCWSVNIPAIN